MKTLLVRHGDLGLKKIKKLPKKMKVTNTKVLITGSHGHNHEIDKGTVYLEKVDDYVIGYMVAKKTTLNHPEHGAIKLDDGVYEMRKQVEYTQEGLVPVVD